MGILYTPPNIQATTVLPTANLTHNYGSASAHILSSYAGEVRREDTNPMLLYSTGLIRNNSVSGGYEYQINGTTRLTFNYDGASHLLTFSNVNVDTRINSSSTTAPFYIFAGASGAEIDLYPASHGSTPGAIDLNATGAGNISLITSSGSVFAKGWQFTSGELIAAGAVDSRIRLGTADGSDNKVLFLSGGGGAGDTRAAIIGLYGNENATPGQLLLNAGNVTGGNVLIRTGGADRWSVGEAGDLLVEADSAYDIATTTVRVATVYADTIDATSYVGLPSGSGYATNTVQTTDATPTTIATISMGADDAVAIEALVIGDGPTGKNYWAKIVGGVRRDGGGSAVLIGTPVVTSDDEGTPGYSATIVVSGNDALIQITGAASETVDWTSKHLASNS